LGFITIVSIIPAKTIIQNVFFTGSGFILSILITFSIKRLIDNFRILEELERGMPDEIKRYLNKTTSAPQKYFYGKSKLSPVEVKKALILIILFFCSICMFLMLILKLLKY